MAEIRKEPDSLGEVNVPADKLWGAQTQRSLGKRVPDRPEPRARSVSWRSGKRLPGKAPVLEADDGLAAETAVIGNFGIHGYVYCQRLDYVLETALTPHVHIESPDGKEIKCHQP
jgi:hypothetical protein